MSSLLSFLKLQSNRIPPTPRAMLLIVVSTLGFSGMHAIIKHTASDLHPFEIAFFRNFFGLLVLAPFFVRHGLAVFRTEKLPLHMLRSGIQVFAMLMFFTAVSISPLAKISAMSFTAPLFATIGAVIFLGERLRMRRITALAVGFIGALIIIRPGLVALDAGAILVLTSSAIWAGAMLIIKVLSRTDSSLTITAYMGLFMTPLSLIPALFVWQWPTAEDYAWLLLMGAVGSLAHVAMAQAFKLAEATAVLPLDFTRLIWASALGFFVFGEVPELFTWIGGLTIFASTTYIAYREARLNTTRAASASAPRPPS